MILDTKNQESVLITLLERYSKYTILTKAESKNADLIAKTIAKDFNPVNDKVITIISDNGVEFKSYECNADYYFSHPYSS